NLRPNGAIDAGGTPTRDSPDDIGNGIWSRKGGTFPSEQVELSKAMKQIRSADLPHTAGYGVVRSSQRSTATETAVQGDLCLADRQHATEEHVHTTEEEPQAARQYSVDILEEHHARFLLHRGAGLGASYKLCTRSPCETSVFYHGAKFQSTCTGQGKTSVSPD